VIVAEECTEGKERARNATMIRGRRKAAYQIGRDSKFREAQSPDLSCREGYSSRVLTDADLVR
jgi:hypothetical protein